MTTQDDDTEEERFSESERPSESESKSSSNSDMDEEDADEESLQPSPPTSQELEETLANDPARAEPSTWQAGYGAPEEVKPADDASIEDMEVTVSEAALTAGGLMSAHSQDTMEVHIPKEEVWSLD